MHRIAKILNKAKGHDEFSILGPRTSGEKVTRASFQKAGGLVFVRSYARRRPRVRVTRKRR